MIGRPRLGTVRRLAHVVSVAVLVTSTGCRSSEGGEPVEQPCTDGQVHALGAPTLGTGRLATFEVAVGGTVWFGVDDWQPLPLDDPPFRSPLQFGPADQPPGPDESGSIEGRTARVVVTSEGWSPLDLEAGSYWVGANSRVGSAQLQVCPGVEVRGVVPAS